jgi:8-amino-7-oxononanoate synthase
LSLFKKQLNKLKDSDYLRKRIVVDNQNLAQVKVKNKLVTSFASNDYLGMSKNSNVISTLLKSASDNGVGSCSSPLITGFSKSHHYLEKEIAEYLSTEACIVVNSGYMANLCVLNIFDKEINVLQDRESHNSIIESSKLNKVRLRRYKHLDNSELEKYLDSKNKNIIFSEAVFSMSGDITNLRLHDKLRNKYKSLLFLDDAHGFGVAKCDNSNAIIENSCSSQNIDPSEVDAYIGTFGKAVGTLGAFICGSKDMIDMIIQKGKPYIYSTALPQCIIDATRKSLKILALNKTRFNKLHRNIDYFNEVSTNRNINTSLSSTPIKTVTLGNPGSTIALRDKFLKHGILVQAIRYPTVPRNQDKIRITLTSNHTKKDIDKLLNTLENIHCEKFTQ